MLDIKFESEKINIVCSPDTVLTEMSFGIEQGINWFFGRGVHAFKCARSKDKGVVSIAMTGLVKSQGLQFSQITSFGSLAKSGFVPKEISKDKVWHIPGTIHEVVEGQHRLLTSKNGGTIMVSHHLNPTTSVGDIAYGLSDLIVGFYWLGATWVKYQCSMAMQQTAMDFGMDAAELKKYLLDKEPAYTLTAKVITLP